MNRGIENLFDSLEKNGIPVDQKYRDTIANKIEAIINYTPRVGVFGKTGAGKSSLCNALFGKELFPISDIEACTRKPQEVLLSMSKSGSGIILIDCPGVGENRARDKEYAKLYEKLLPNLDLVLWVLKGDDRAFSTDLDFYKNLVKPSMVDQDKPFFIVLNQVDKIEPFREWNEDKNRPGSNQEHNIEEKCRYVTGVFGVSLSTVVPVSATEQYGLVKLVDCIVHKLPNTKKASVAKSIREENRSIEAEEEAKDGFIESIFELAVEFLPIPPVGKIILRSAKKAICDMAGSLWKGFTSFFGF